MYHVLLAVDDDEDRTADQIETLRSLPGRDDLRVTVVHVHETVDAPADEAGRSVIESINDEIGELQGLPETVTTVRDAVDDLGVPVEVTERTGDAAEEVLAEAEERDADAILLAARKRSPAGKALFGSVTQRIIIDGERPVIVAGDR
ncbi:universal stress protein [Halobaculum magnesiiphilum]|uniref:Universal stress protein n=1 Tax=Halobaculum magnesiiphilum TaxID=1017351 RepID=A0A8T8WHY0_9EURY|nr:universal stress protein [Halobaculum magnesiiphilum]QZP39450.1 universal stress protein [Halobaculum magnesiiphilum]